MFFIKRTRASMKSSIALVVAVLVASLSVVSGASAAPSKSATYNGITVWLDAPRLAAGQAYVAKNPNAKIRIVTIDKSTVLAKISLANQAKSGWPDLVWPGDPATIGILASKQINFAANIASAVPASIRSGFAKGALAGCEIHGGLYCLRNDLGQTVLWYDAVLMKRYGYEVPTTWGGYAALGKKVASEHPGTIIGTLGGKTGAGAYFVSSECKTRDLISPRVVAINTSGIECTRVANMLQPLVNNGSMAAVDYADPTVAALGSGDKILMMPGPSYYGLFAFRDAYHVPSGRIAAAPMPTWGDQTKPVAGSAGGGILVVSRHSSTMERNAAIAMALWMTTNIGLQKSLPGFPAYAPAATEWCKSQSAIGYFANDPCVAMTQMASLVTPTFGSVTYQPQWETTYNGTIVAAARKKGSMLDALKVWGQQLKSAAKGEGYVVATK